jgi:hypothetical protein
MPCRAAPRDDTCGTDLLCGLALCDAADRPTAEAVGECRGLVCREGVCIGMEQRDEQPKRSLVSLERTNAKQKGMRENTYVRILQVEDSTALRYTVLYRACRASQRDCLVPFLWLVRACRLGRQAYTKLRDTRKKCIEAAIGATAIARHHSREPAHQAGSLLRLAACK